MLQLIDISVENDSVKDKKILEYEYDENNRYPFVVIGRGSYIVNARISSTLTASKEDFDEGIHNILIGQFCSLSGNLFFTINRNHDYKSVTTSASSLIGNKEYKIKRKGQILIQNDVWIGHSVKIMSGVTIHNGAVIAANSNVVSDVPAYSIVGGNPAKVIGYRFSKDIIDKLLKIKWWEWSDEKIIRNREMFHRSIEEFCEKFYYEDKKEENQMDIDFSLYNEKYLFYMDFTDEYCLWDKVYQEFYYAKKNNEKCILFVYIDKEVATEQEKIINDLHIYLNKLKEKNNAKCTIKVVFGDKDNDTNLFKYVDYYITNRNSSTIRYSTYADDNGVKIISGVDCPIF